MQSVFEDERAATEKAYKGIFWAQGEIIETGGEAILQHGFCWGTSANPRAIHPDTTQLGPLPQGDTITFSSRLRRLIGEQTYYVRAYAVTEIGDTVYSESLTFDTPFESYLEMVEVPGGRIELGGNLFVYENPVREIEISGFRMGKFEVVQPLWEAIMDTLPSHHKPCKTCPVEKVSWDIIQIFLEKLNQRTGRSFRLPTEAEWEYAARGAIRTKNFLYSGGDDLDEVGWYAGNVPIQSIMPVGLKKPNELGIYDMSGNVSEWCADWADPYSFCVFAFGFATECNQYLPMKYYDVRPDKDPSGPDQYFNLSFKVVRGGNFALFEKFAFTVPHRRFQRNELAFFEGGFRIAETIN